MKQVTLGEWLSDYHPAGKTAQRNSPFNLPGRVAWCVMEVIGPINLAYLLYPHIGNLSNWNLLAASLYIIHYINRSIVNPLFVAPSIAPTGIMIVASAAWFNWLNSTCLAGWILGIDHLGYSSSDEGENQGFGGVLPYIGLLLFVIGMIGNIRGERTLWRLRREEALRRQQQQNEKGDSAEKKKGKNPFDNVYVIPPAKGLFRFVLYPHYLSEWLEWLGYVLVGTAVLPGWKDTASLPLPLAPWFVPFAALAKRFAVPFPLPAVAFLVNEVTAMVPQAKRGRRWYVNRFGEKAVGGRSAVIPGVSFL